MIWRKENYYEDLYKFLSSKENAKYINDFNESKINWKLVKYPIDLIDENMKQATKDKKNIIIEIKQKILKLKIIICILLD